MYYDGLIWMGEKDGERYGIHPRMANRHGLIAGATGTGKTITLKVTAESFSDAGVPVFLADVKGDLAGMCRPGQNTEDMEERIRQIAADKNAALYGSYDPAGCGLEMTDLYDIYHVKTEKMMDTFYPVPLQ